MSLRQRFCALPLSQRGSGSNMAATLNQHSSGFDMRLINLSQVGFSPSPVGVRDRTKDVVMLLAGAGGYLSSDVIVVIAEINIVLVD